MLFSYGCLGCKGLGGNFREQGGEVDFGGGNRTAFIELKFQAAVFFEQVFEPSPGIAQAKGTEPATYATARRMLVLVTGQRSTQ